MKCLLLLAETTKSVLSCIKMPHMEVGKPFCLESTVRLNLLADITNLSSVQNM